MKTFGVTDCTNLAPLKCCGRMDRRTDGWTDGVDPLLDLLSLERRRYKYLTEEMDGKMQKKNKGVHFKFTRISVVKCPIAPNLVLN